MTYLPLIAGALLFCLLFALNRAFPLRRETAALVPRLGVNLVLSLLAFAAVTYIVEPAILASLGMAEGRLGLLLWLEPSVIVEFVLAFLWFDCTFYLWHRLNHLWPFLWRFHHVHHIDADLDVTTSFRFHFGEIALSAIFRVLQILFIGASFRAYLFYEVCFQIETMFHHSNVKLPIATERLLSKVFVTPRMHGIHHSEIREENRSNFSVVLSVWDRLFATLRLNVPQDALNIGLPAYGKQTAGIWYCLVAPFLKQRDYWRNSEGTLLIEREQKAAGSTNQLAE